MSAEKIDGKAFAENLRHKLAEEVELLKSQHGVTPGLAVLLVGADAASEVYVRNKKKATIETGMHSFDFHLPANISRADLLKKIAELNADEKVDGILVQLPLPRREDEEAVIQAIDPAKDVDGFHVINAGKLFLGHAGLVPCTPSGCLMLLKDKLGDLSGKHAVVLGRSNIVGKPMAALLLAQDCTVTIAHSKTPNLAEECRRADIIIAAVGRPEMVRGDWIKKGATIIDVGINRTESGLVGDVCYAEAAEHAAYITPVPGGVGPMTIACLLHNTLKAACLRRGIVFKQL